MWPAVAPLYPFGFRFSLPCRGRQLEGERGAPALAGRVHPDATSHRVHEAAHDEEPEPGAARRIRSVELAKDALLLHLGNADALVGDGNLDAVVALPGGDRDSAPGGRVAHRVLDEVRQHLPQLLGIGRGGERLRRQVDDEVVPVRAGAADDVGDRGSDVGRGDADLEVAAVEARGVEGRVDDRRQPLRLGRDVAEERPPLLLAEEDVLAQQRLGEP